MAGIAWPFNETGTSGAPAVTARQLRQQQSAFVAMGTTARPLGAKSGIRVGTPSTVVSITGSGPYGWSAGGFGGVIDGEANVAAGPYTYSFETADTGTITASGASARVDSLDVQISDSDEGDGSGAKSVQVVYTQGAATGGQPPAAPPRSHRLALINVPTSGAPTIMWAPDWSGDPGEWTFNTIAERDAYVTLIGSANVPVNQRATVIADTTTANNGDYAWSGSAWLPTVGAYTVGAFTPTGIYSKGTPTPQVVAQNGRAWLEGLILSSSASFAAGTTYTLGSIPAAFAPAIPAGQSRIFAASANTIVLASLLIDSTGTLKWIPNTAFTNTLSLNIDGPSWRLQ